MNYNEIINDNGVYLYKDPSFNTIVFQFDFKAPLGNREQAIKTILGDYMAKVTKDYKCEEDFNRKQKELYSTEISISNSIYNNYALYTITFDIVSFNAVNDDYSSDIFEFMNSILLRPDFTNEEILETIKRVYINEKISSLSSSDKVASKLYKSNVYYDKEREFERSTDPKYIEEIISSITLEDLENMYNEIINNFHKCFVFGDISDEEFKKFRKSIPFKNDDISIDYKNKRPIKSEETIIDARDVNESIIYVTYEIDEMSYSTYELIWSIFNSSCGLCSEILREKYGLVYTSYVQMGLYDNTFSFYAKIDKDNKDKLLSAIDEIIELASNPKNLKELLEFSKESIKQEKYALTEDKDQLMGTIENYINGVCDEREVEEEIKSTTESDISFKIKTLRNRNVFMYRGIGNE